MSFALAMIAGFITVAVPLVFTAWLWKGKYTSRADWLLRVLAAASVIVFFTLAGAWAYSSVWLRYGVKALFIYAAVKTFPRLEDRKIFGKRDSHGKVRYNGRIAFLAVFLILDFLVIKGRFHKGEAVELSFPLRDGRFLVVQGGASPITNFFHNSDPSQKYALDIVKVGALGNRANGFFPDALSSYKVFGEYVYSPCSGAVAGALDGLPDNRPGEADEKNTAGNHIVLDCGETRVLLAHLMRESITVKAGQFVKVNTVMGRVGNSGNTAEPHLHIQAWKIEKADSPVAMKFNGEFLVKNRTVRN